MRKVCGLIYCIQKVGIFSGESSDTSPNENILLSLEEYLEAITFLALNAKNMESEMTMTQILRPDLPPSYFANKEENTSLFSILQPNISLPPQVTTYWCSVGKIPENINGKIHAIGFGANVTKGNEDIVHHMEVSNQCIALKQNRIEPIENIFLPRQQ